MKKILGSALLVTLAAVALGGCVVAPAPYYARPVYVAHPGARVWVPGRCDLYGRCGAGYWVVR